MAQLERFIGNASKHHLHIEIGQEHYKFGKDKGSRIEIGKYGRYLLDQLIVARNHLVDHHYESDGGRACIDWLENECRTHDDWVKGQNFTPSWEAEEKPNAYVNATMTSAKVHGFDRAGFENSFIQAKNETLDEVGELFRRTDSCISSYYAPDEDGVKPTLESIESAIEESDLKAMISRWSGFRGDVHSPQTCAEEFKRDMKAMLHQDLSERFAIDTQKDCQHYHEKSQKVPAKAL